MAKKILIIDDDRDFVEATTMLLESKGFEVFYAYGGEEGVAKAIAEKPKIILLDVMMSYAAEGFDVARKLNDLEDTKGIPLVLITGIRKEMNLPFGFAPDANMLPVKAVLEKPVKPQTLLKVIEDNIGS